MTYHAPAIITLNFWPPKRKARPMRKTLCALFASATIGLALAAATPAMASSTCPPSDAVWTNNAKYTGQPYPHAVGNLDGYDYYLNNDQWNEQSTSNQTMWLESDNDFGVCSYQPTSPNADKAYPGAVLNLNDPVGTDPPLAGPAIDSFSAISSSATETQPTSTYGEFQWMWTSSSVLLPQPPARQRWRSSPTRPAKAVLPARRWARQVSAAQHTTCITPTL